MGRDGRDTGPTSSRGRHGNSYIESTEHGRMVSSSKGKREVLVKHCRKLGTPTANETFDEEFDKEINAWVNANVNESEREERGSDGLQRVCKR